VDATEREREYLLFFVAAKKSLVGPAYLYTGNIDDAHDLVQEVLVRAWKHWPKVSGYDDPQAWARRVLHNLAVSRWRKHRVRRSTPLPPLPDVAEPDSARLDLVNALRRLPLDQQRALILHDVQGLSVVEIAREIGVPEGTVRSWLSRGRTALQRDLGIDTEPVTEERRP
jgi:RNA polymerase sigma-70 factor, ECF subfamily